MYKDLDLIDLQIAELVDMTEEERERDFQLILDNLNYCEEI
jgi:hypothetical protein